MVPFVVFIYDAFITLIFLAEYTCHEHIEISFFFSYIYLLHALTSGAGEDYSFLRPDSHIDYIYILFLHVLTFGV